MKLISDGITNMSNKIVKISDNISELTDTANRYVNDAINEKEKANFTSALEQLYKKYSCSTFSPNTIISSEEDKKKCDDQEGDINRCAKTIDDDVILCDNNCSRMNGDCKPKITVSNTYYQKYKNANVEQCGLYVTNPDYCKGEFKKWMDGKQVGFLPLRVKANDVMLLIDDNNEIVN